MLSDKVTDICKANFDYACTRCPLFLVCDMPHEEMRGETPKEKTAWWEIAMNAAAEEVTA